MQRVQETFGHRVRPPYTQCRRRRQRRRFVHRTSEGTHHQQTLRNMCTLTWTFDGSALQDTGPCQEVRVFRRISALNRACALLHSPFHGTQNRKGTPLTLVDEIAAEERVKRMKLAAAFGPLHVCTAQPHPASRNRTRRCDYGGSGRVLTRHPSARDRGISGTRGGTESLSESLDTF